MGGKTNPETRKKLYTPTYQSWQAMKQRCLQKGHKYYPNYGGRGITICDKWLSYAGFLEDMGERPEGKTLDRLKSDLGYYKDNCQWADRVTQNRNNSQVHQITYKGETKCLAEWCQVLGLNYINTHHAIFRKKLGVDHVFG